MKNYYLKSTEYLGVKDGKSISKIHHLHIDIMNAPEGYSVDHVNHNTLDNRKSNLRIVKQRFNTRNRKGANSNNNTGVRNVSYIKRSNEYWVQLMKNGIKYKWVYPADKFKEACEFAELKRNELFGDYAGNS